VTSPREFHASYRYELRDGEWVIARYACRDAGVATHQHDERTAGMEFVGATGLGRDVQHA
jgi:hypothetical protein